jgi:hypothetical protein
MTCWQLHLEQQSLNPKQVPELQDAGIFLCDSFLVQKICECLFKERIENILAIYGTLLTSGFVLRQGKSAKITDVVY